MTGLHDYSCPSCYNGYTIYITYCEVTTVTMISVQEKIEATINKLNLWFNHLEKGKYDSFHSLGDFS